MTDLKKLSEVFEKRIFVVPDYQRGYAWTDEERADLTGDLEDLHRIHQKGRQGYLHYTGTIVAKRGTLEQKPQRRVNAVTYEVFEIVDGQQRITTLVIFLHEIAIFLENLGNDERESARNIKKNYVEIQTGVTWRLNLNGALDGFFKSNVLRDGIGSTTQPAEKNLLDAKTFFRSYLEKKKLEKSDRFSAYLDDLCALITEDLGFVWHEVGGEHEVSVIFETMNSRGKLLTQFEKVKNLLFFLIGRHADENELTSLTTQINQTWSYVPRTLHTGAPYTEEDQLLRYFWAISASLLV